MYYRKVIKIKAENSPNVIYGMAERSIGRTPSNRVIIEGILTWSDYINRRTHWDKIQQCVSLDGEFNEDADTLLYPPHWLNLSESNHRKLSQIHSLRCLDDHKGLGIDPAEGGDKTSYCVVDRKGIVELISKKTRDTSVIVGEIIALMKKYRILSHKVCIDQGGGKQHADRLRQEGYDIHTVAFGSSPTQPINRASSKDRQSMIENKYTYKNKRAEMYGILRLLLDPHEQGEDNVFAIPSSEVELRRQLSLMPLLYDSEGRMYMLPKNKLPGAHQRCLVDIIGHSPDEADAVVLAVYAMMRKSEKVMIGAIG